MMPRKKLDLCAHRGGPNHLPENSLAAFKRALDLGFNKIEADIQITRDNVVIIMHDSTLSRTTNASDSLKNTPIQNLLFSDLENLVLLSKDGKTHKIPTLEELFSLIQNYPTASIVLDIKSLNIEKNLFPLIQKFHVENQVIITTNLPAVCSEAKRISPKISTMLWISRESKEIALIFDETLKNPFINSILILLNPSDDSKWPYHIDLSDLKHFHNKAQQANKTLSLLAPDFSKEVLKTLIKSGFDSFSTDNLSKLLANTESFFF